MLSRLAVLLKLVHIILKLDLLLGLLFFMYSNKLDSFFKVSEMFKTQITVSFNCNLKLIFWDFPTKRLLITGQEWRLEARLKKEISPSLNVQFVFEMTETDDCFATNLLLQITLCKFNHRAHPFCSICFGGLTQGIQYYSVQAKVADMGPSSLPLHFRLNV